MSESIPYYHYWAWVYYRRLFSNWIHNQPLTDDEIKEAVDFFIKFGEKLKEEKND